MTNYPPGFHPDSLEAREAFQGDVSRRVVEITVEVEAEMVNHQPRMYDAQADIHGALLAALRKSWEDEQEEKKAQ